VQIINTKVSNCANVTFDNYPRRRYYNGKSKIIEPSTKSRIWEVTEP